MAPPPGGVIYLDANALIYSVETHPLYWPLSKPLWANAFAGRVLLATSELSLLETLVAPIKNSDAMLIAGYENILSTPEVSVHPITRDILREAARLRASVKKLRTSDSIHAATALVHPPSIFLTNDAAFRNIPGLPVTVLSDLLAP